MIVKGLVAIPTIEELAGAYARLQASPDQVVVAELVLWSQWSRFDPRLAEQWVSHVVRHWRRIPSGELNQQIAPAPWPTAAAALIEVAASLAIRDPAERQAFRRWASSATIGVAPALNEQFFIGNRAFAGVQMHDDARLAIAPFTRWGFLSREVLINKARINGTLLSPETRLRAIDALIADLKRQGRRHLRVEDYRQALDGRVSVRQAEKDLAAHPKLRPVGRTRARYYRLSGA